MLRRSLTTIVFSFFPTLFFGITIVHAAENGAQVDDAYARAAADGQHWTLGTAALELSFATVDGRFGLVGYANKLTTPNEQYVPAGLPVPPFALKDSRPDKGRFLVESLWTKYLPAGSEADLANDRVQVEVRKGDRLGFAVGPHGNYTGDETEWITTVDYGDGQQYVSSEETTLEQGPIWSYYVHRIGSGQVEPLDTTGVSAYAEEKLRIASSASGWLASLDVPHVGPTKMHPAPGVNAVRVWTAPRDGKVTLGGKARHFKGSGDVDLIVLRLREKPSDYVPPTSASAVWMVQSAEALASQAGGRPVVELRFVLKQGMIVAKLTLVAYPHTSIVRQRITLENTGTEPVDLPSPCPLVLAFQDEAAGPFVHRWMIGGNSGPTQGNLETRDVTAPYHQLIEGQMTDAYVPWMALERKGKPGDGSFATLDYLGLWRMAVDRDPDGPTLLSAQLPELAGQSLAAGQQLEMPLVTLGVYAHNLDDLGCRLYDWQYEYLWDFTHDAWYGRMSHAVPWWPDCKNLQENFAGRLGGLDMAGVDVMREMGYELLWDDAGWSESPNIWSPSREGPDFSQTLRYLDKTGMKWIVWFCGWPKAELMDAKVGAWGNFQWRTDGLGGFTVGSDRAFRRQVEKFLLDHPRCSFHTCSGGGRYAHTFEIQRYTDVNYFSDGGRGPQTNHAFSYLDTPDKWLDIITAFERDGKYDPDVGRMILTMTPFWYLHMRPDDPEQLRRIGEIYRFLQREGVAGRWSYVFHPRVEGDVEDAYFQRTSHDRTKACIILKHRAPGAVTIYPRGLLAEHAYVVGFDSTQTTTTRSGADLMTNGIPLQSTGNGELIWLGLPHRPRGGSDHTPPTAPGRVCSRRETNLGHSGVALYWAPGVDDQAVSYYEIRRADQIAGKAATGTYYFDHAQGWNPASPYAVRSVDADGNSSDWTTAEPLPNEPREAAALGGLFSEAGREGWSAETTSDGRTYEPMRWVPPAKPSSGDTGGTANQPGGAEGYWEAATQARVGRGWQQAAAAAACVRTWTAPQAGEVRVVGRVTKEYYRRNDGLPLRARILHGERQVWPDSDWATVPVGDLNGLSHDIVFNVAKGDTLRFVLDQNAEPEKAVIAWMPRIVYASQQEAKPATTTVVRIRCGAEKPYTDRCENQWSADRFFQGGEPVAPTAAQTVAPTAAIENATPTAADQPLYQLGRTGNDFSYKIPVAPGLYSLRLKLAEPECPWAFQRPWSLEINGRRVLDDFDICHAARGPRRACEQVFRYLVPDAQGNLVLRFHGGSAPLQVSDKAIVQAIEVLPEKKSTYRAAFGAQTPWIDWNGCVWEPARESRSPNDATFLTSTATVSQASPTIYDQQLYRTAWSGKQLTTAFEVSPGLYTVHLKFAELWLSEPGKRPMNVDINGCRVRENWDPATAAGKVGMAADLRIEDVAPDAQGKIAIHVESAGANAAILQAIELE
jgi:hypothetical protein